MNTSKSFSSAKRNEMIEELTATKFDLLVIGGGITGAGIALDAASRGLRVALVEMNDFATATSSRSTKLVHGGLRYLENFEIKLVSETAKEREIVHQNAQHIVISQKMILPIIKTGKLQRFTTSIALTIYDYLAGVKKLEKHRMLSKQETLALEPNLNAETLLGGAMYYEYKTDDSRLTIEALKRAAEFGALSVNYVEVKKFLYENGTISGATCNDKIGNREINISAKIIVNAAGVWVDELRKFDNSLKGKRLHITKGIHIVVSRERLKLNHAIYFDTPDKRMVFAIPRFNIVYIGTTDTNYSGDYHNPSIDTNDVNYLLEATNRIFPQANLQTTDVQSSWAGLRPLIHEEGKAPTELSRKDEIFVSDSGLLSIAGGKLTGYRHMAEQVVDMVCKKIAKAEKRTFDKCKTRNIPLSGSDFGFEAEIHHLIEYNDKKYDEAKHTGISVEAFKNLFYRYGTNIDIVTEQAYNYWNESKDSIACWTRAETWYAVNYEMATSLCDFFIRRSGMIYFFIEEIETMLPLVVEEMAKLLNWSDEVKKWNIDELETEVKKAKIHF